MLPCFVCIQIAQFDLASPPPSLQQQYYIQQQQHHSLNAQPSLLIASCQGATTATAYPSPITPLTVTGLNTATLDRFQTPSSPSLFVSTNSTNPVCSSNEPVREPSMRFIVTVSTSLGFFFLFLISTFFSMCAFTQIVN